MTKNGGTTIYSVIWLSLALVVAVASVAQARATLSLTTRSRVPFSDTTGNGQVVTATLIMDSGSSGINVTRATNTYDSRLRTWCSTLNGRINTRVNNATGTVSGDMSHTCPNAGNVTEVQGMLNVQR